MVEELRRNLEIERIKTSEAISDLKAYIEKEQFYDPMINPPKDNPFQPGMKICKILWIDLWSVIGNSFKPKQFTKICIYVYWLIWGVYFFGK